LISQRKLLLTCQITIDHHQAEEVERRKGDAGTGSRAGRPNEVEYRDKLEWHLSIGYIIVDFPIWS
jgi:hypothetical protein